MAKIIKSLDTCKNAPPLDTLAQLRTKGEKESLNLSAVTTIDDKKLLLKRARRKYFTHGLIIGLCNAADKNPNSKLRQSYWNSYHCNCNLTQFSDGSVLGKYCKNRWCMVCNSIRTAQSINTYVPLVADWKDACFCTATRPNVKAENLEQEIEELFNIVKKIKDKIYKRYYRGNRELPLIGIRKFECTYNAIKDTYHPHFHIVFMTKDMGIEFLGEWMKSNPTANNKGQDIRSVDDNSLCELFKYMTKVISKTGKGKKVIYADAMDNIFNAMSDRRVMQNFGFKIPKVDIFEGEINCRGMALDVFKWHQKQADWISNGGQKLSNYEPAKDFKKFVKKGIICR